MGNLIDKEYHSIVRAWREEGDRSRQELESALDDYRVRFAYHSGRIENPAITYHDTRDVFEDGRVHSFSGDPRTLFEIQNLKECHELMLDCLERRVALSEELVLRFHRTITQGTYDERRWAAGERPGTYKRGDYVVGAGDVGALPDEVSGEIAALVSEVNDATHADALTVGAYFHAVFENIHPFADGNGRCGRELMNYLLLLHDHPPIIIFEDDRLAYYGAVEAWDAEHDLDPMKEFLRVESVRTWRRNRRLCVK